ncbi:MAG: heme-binding protein [Anaerolineae bacterium]|nr:heme-binding protein [Anaerolineae bacterium]
MVDVAYKLSHADAMRVLAAVQAAMERDQVGAAVAVTDAHGELMAFMRTDGCPLASIQNAIHKAFTSARERTESGNVGARAREEGWPLTNFGDPRYTGWGGAVPLMHEGKVVGAVGVSGLSEAEDVALARVGAAALRIGKTELLQRIEHGWHELLGFLSTLDDAQRTQKTDAVGWTVIDHVVHIAMWEDSINALLAHEPRSARMGIDEATWTSGDFEKINAVLQQRSQAMSWDEVMRMLHNVHRECLAKLGACSDDDLYASYKAFQADATSDLPIIRWIIGNSYEHYAEHIPWMQAIAG